MHLSFIHDDCIENDQLYTGVVEDSLLDGCYVAFSARPSSGDSVDGHENTETFRDNVVRLQPMPTVYKGRAPGNGGFFKWDDKAHRAPRLVVQDNVFRVDQRPNHQTLGLPDGLQGPVLEQRGRLARQGSLPRQAPQVLQGDAGPRGVGSRGRTRGRPRIR